MLTENGSSMFIGSPVILIPRSVSHHRPGVRDDQPSQYDTNDWFSIENESLLLCSLAVISLRITWALRHAHRLGILLVRPLRMQSHQATQIGPGCVVDYFHDGTSLLCKLLLPAVYRSCSFRRKATMLVHTSGHEVGNPYTQSPRMEAHILWQNACSQSLSV